MNRKIKFRGWNGNYMEGPFELGSVLAGDSHDPDWKVMQFTGLLDRNGKEIYEGDIVKERIFNRESWHIVYWNNKDARWDLRFSDNESIPYISHVHSFFVSGRCEVIGNTWENPEILEKGNDDIKHIP